MDLSHHVRAGCTGHKANRLEDEDDCVGRPEVRTAVLERGRAISTLHNISDNTYSVPLSSVRQTHQHYSTSTFLSLSGSSP